MEHWGAAEGLISDDVARWPGTRAAASSAGNERWLLGDLSGSGGGGFNDQSYRLSQSGRQFGRGAPTRRDHRPGVGRDRRSDRRAHQADLQSAILSQNQVWDSEALPTPRGPRPGSTSSSCCATGTTPRYCARRSCVEGDRGGRPTQSSRSGGVDDLVAASPEATVSHTSGVGAALTGEWKDAKWQAWAVPEGGGRLRRRHIGADHAPPTFQHGRFGCPSRPTAARSSGRGAAIPPRFWRALSEVPRAARETPSHASLAARVGTAGSAPIA